MTEDLPTICPFCDQHHELVTAVIGDSGPDDGDVTICFGCGRPSVFDQEARGGLRKPTKTEQHRFDRDKTMQEMIAGWKIVKRQ